MFFRVPTELRKQPNPNHLILNLIFEISKSYLIEPNIYKLNIFISKKFQFSTNFDDLCLNL